MIGHPHKGIAADPSASVADLPNRCCAVCGCVGAAVFCAVYSCRPCASFFRRSVKDRREYKCRADDNCPIDKNGMRNCCRACRLRRCFLAGMRPELIANERDGVCLEQKSVILRANFRESSPRLPMRAICDDCKIGANSPSVFAGECFPLPSFPSSGRICQVFREFCERQKAVCAQNVGIGTVLCNKLRAITRDEYNRIERGCVVLLLGFVRAIFPQIDSVPTQQKVRILKTFTFHFKVLHSCELTIKDFPAGECLPQFVVVPGCLLDLDKFAATLTGPGKEQQIVFCRQYLSRFSHFITHTYKPLGIGPMEFAAIQGIQLWKCVDEEMNFQFGTASGGQPIDELFFELHSMITASHGADNPKAIAVRFGRILSMLTDVSDLGHDLNELFTLCKVFLDPESCVNSNDLWDEMFEEKGKEGQQMAN